MLFSGYLSKHLYGRIVSSQSESIKTPLDDEELKALKKFKVSYKIVFNNDGEPIYILDTQELKSFFVTEDNCHINAVNKFTNCKLKWLKEQYQY